MNEPNIFSFATSELSQDAAIAYHLSWADGQYRDIHPKKHKLGLDLLQLLVGDRAKDLNIGQEKIDVGLQSDHIDVRVDIACQAVLIIEDKTNTLEHGDQINRYSDTVAKWLDAENREWGHDRVIATYLKTGNESIATANKIADGVNKVYRPDLLQVLNQHTDTRDDIIDQFRGYLQRWEEETTSYLTTPVKEDWSWRGVEGFYMALESAFSKEGLTSGSWMYVSNQTGGFLAFYWNWVWISEFKCNLYLQINHAKLLEIRVGDVRDGNDHHIKAGSSLRWGLLRRLQEISKNEKYSSLKINKTGRYKHGWTGGVAQVNDFLEEGEDGIVDMDATVSKLKLVMGLLSESAGGTEDPVRP